MSPQIPSHYGEAEFKAENEWYDVLSLFKPNNDLTMVREGRTNIFRAARSRKHIHGIFGTKDRSEYINILDHQ